MMIRNPFHHLHLTPTRAKHIAILVLIVVCAALMLAPRYATAAKQNLTFEDRIAYQRAIEAVSWQHRLWPKDNPQPKPSLNEVMPESAIHAKVENYLRQSNALERYGQQPITSEQLQAEMERMARQTKQPEVLRELWAALGNDPFIIAECLARPQLVNRLLHNWYASDERFHGELKRRAEAELSYAESIDQMRQMSGEYRETTWIKGKRTADARHHSDQPNTFIADPAQWSEHVQKLSARVRSTGFSRAVSSSSQNPPEGGTTNANARVVTEQLPLGQLSGLQEDEEKFSVVMVLEQSDEHIKVASVEWKKVSFDEWWSGVQGELGAEAPASEAEFKLPLIEATSTDCTSETWTPVSAFTGVLDSLSAHTAVWTGSEMIVFGGSSTSNISRRYNPATDTWTATNTSGAPSQRFSHSAVWTGSEMIVWGGALGNNQINTGGRYNPATDTWRATSTTGAPDARSQHTAVWTGSEMFIWGGVYNSFANAVWRYNPVTDTWTATGFLGVPDKRSLHTAVWTGSEMIIWGGSGNVNTGWRYNPVSNTWTATNLIDAPNGRSRHTAVWTGSEMIIWGGLPTPSASIGGRYNPTTNTWTATGTTGAPTARYNHTAVWTGSEMIVWGGNTGVGASVNLNTGGRYNPASNTWIATNTTGAPSARQSHTAVWTGSEMIVWGGSSTSATNTGGRYNPATDAWTATSTIGPATRSDLTAVWTGSEMIVWGRSSNTPGERYNPATDTWTATNTTGAPSSRISYTAVWTGKEMIVWGGTAIINPAPTSTNTGGRYNPTTDTWTATGTTGAPSARSGHTAVWTGSEMIVWGSSNTGGRYNPVTDTWTATSTIGTPTARSQHTAVWTGSEMIVWGGNSSGNVNTGGRYNPVTDTWTDTNITGAPSARLQHTAVWTGSEMIVWGGSTTNTGGRYNPVTNAWAATSAMGAPNGRSLHTGVWTGKEMIVWGGLDNSTSTYFNTGGRYNPATDTWTATSMTGAPSARSSHTAVWTGNEMIIWGQDNSGAVYKVSLVPTAISPAGQSFSANGGTGSVAVTACNWTATSNANWITITSGSNGSVNGTVNYSVAANTTASQRTGTITIASQTFTVMQAAAAACQTVSSINPTSGSVASQVTITGANLTGVAAVKFAGNAAATFTVNSDTQITATVPSGALTGLITLSKPGCADVSTPLFTIGPGPSLVSVNGRQLMVRQRNSDGTLGAPAPYIIRAVDWSPASKNTNTSKTDPDNANVRRAEFGKWYLTDIPLMKAMNVNTVRMFMDPGFDATGWAVLDELYRNGIMVIMTVDDAKNDTVRAPQAVDFYKNHPAVLMWMLGSEWNINKYFGAAASVDDAAQRTENAAKLIKPKDANHPVATSYGEINITPATPHYVNDVCASIDVWALNIYRGNTFTDLFKQWADLSSKPMLIGEFGTDALRATGPVPMPPEILDETMQADWDINLWNDLFPHLSGNNPTQVALGGCVFEWNDEWWKVGQPTVHDTGGCTDDCVNGHPDGFANEEYFGIVDIDRHLRRVYNAFKAAFDPAYQPPATIAFHAVSRGGAAPEYDSEFGVAIFFKQGAIFYRKTGGDKGGRGFNVAAISGTTGEVLDAQNFDTYMTRDTGTAATAMIGFLNKYPNGTLFLLAVADEAGLTLDDSCTLRSSTWTQALLQALDALHSQEIRKYCFRDSWAMATVKGENQPRAEQRGHGIEVSADTAFALTPSNSISGVVNYGTSSTPKPVPGVTLTAAGAPSATSTTSSIGNYNLAGLGSGPYTVTPTKTGSVNGISAFDASLVAQHAVGLMTLTPNQQIAADASGNGTISAFDASLIAQTAAGIANTGIAGTWKFVPATRSYSSLSGNQTNQNFDAILVGDVSGNWTPPASSASVNSTASSSHYAILVNSSATSLMSKSPNIKWSNIWSNIIPPLSSAITVALPKASDVMGTTVTIPITVGDLTGRGVTAYDFTLAFDPNVLQLSSPAIDAANTLSSAMSIVTNAATPGQLTVSAFQARPLTGAGTLLNLKFKVVGQAGSTTTLTWSPPKKFTFNEGEPAVELTSGSFTVSSTGRSRIRTASGSERALTSPQSSEQRSLPLAVLTQMKHHAQEIPHDEPR